MQKVYPDIKFRAFGDNVPKGFKPFGKKPRNRDGLYARRNTRRHPRRGRRL